MSDTVFGVFSGSRHFVSNWRIRGFGAALGFIVLSGSTSISMGGQARDSLEARDDYREERIQTTERLFDYEQFAEEGTAIQVAVSLPAEARPTGDPDRLTASRRIYSFSDVGFLELIGDAAHKAQVAHIWKNDDLFIELERQLSWLGRQAGVFKRRDLVVSALQRLAAGGESDLAKRVLDLIDRLGARPVPFDLVPVDRIAAFQTLTDCGPDALKLFERVATPTPGKVGFTVGDDPAILEGEPEDVAWLLAGLVAADARDGGLAEGIVDYLERQVAGDTPPRADQTTQGADTTKATGVRRCGS